MQLEPGCSILMHNKVLAIVGILQDEVDPMVSVMKVGHPATRPFALSQRMIFTQLTPPSRLALSPARCGKHAASQVLLWAFAVPLLWAFAKNSCAARGARHRRP